MEKRTTGTALVRTEHKRVDRAGNTRHEALPVWIWHLRGQLARTSGQGTVEFAILVGVLVVIAVLAITVFRPKIQELWTAIADGINGL